MEDSFICEFHLCKEWRSNLSRTADSTCKCTIPDLAEDLIGEGPVAQAFMRPVIYSMHCLSNLLLDNSAEVAPFRKILPQQTVSVFVATALPSSIGVDKIDFQAGCLPEFFEADHLAAVVQSQRLA